MLQNVTSFIRLLNFRHFYFKESVLERVKRSGFGGLNTVMFSPAEPTVITVAEAEYGVAIYDIRNWKK